MAKRQIDLADERTLTTSGVHTNINSNRDEQQQQVERERERTFLFQVCSLRVVHRTCLDLIIEINDTRKKKKNAESRDLFFPLA